MAAVSPSKNTPKIIEEFIRYAQQHLSTVSGLINTTSVFPGAPSPIILPSVVNWTGYFVTPAMPSVAINSLQQSELTEVEEEELKEQIKTEEELTRENLGEAKEILQSGAFSTQLDEEVLTTYISNLEEKIENSEIISEGLRELKVQKKQTSIYGDGATITPDPIMTFNTNSDIQSIFTENEEPKQPIKKLPQTETLKLIETSLIKVGITDAAIIRAVKANALKESGAQPIIEDMAGYAGTENPRIRRIFGDRAAKYTDAQLNEIKKTAQGFGDLMYGPSTKVGQTLGNVNVGDGYRYRGRGFIQLTGRGNYTAASLSLYKDDRLVKNPDSVATIPIAADTLGYFIKKNMPRLAKKMGLNPIGLNQADANELITSVIAGDVIRRGDKNFIATEGLRKVDEYSKKLA